MGLRKKFKKIIYKLKFKKINFNKIEFNNKNILVTGTNSGIGLELTKKLLNLNNNVFAIYNEKSDNLDKIKNNHLFLIKCDLSQLKEIEKIKNKLQNNIIDIIINNAGNFGGEKQKIEDIDFDMFIKIISLNALSVLKLINIVINSQNNGSKLKKIINISSQMGSITENNEGAFYIYRISKSALNSITKNLSIDLFKKNQTITFAIHPGSVKSKTNTNGYINPDQCAENIIKMIYDSDISYNGKFFDLQTNKEIFW